MVRYWVVRHVFLVMILPLIERLKDLPEQIRASVIEVNDDCMKIIHHGVAEGEW